MSQVKESPKVLVAFKVCNFKPDNSMAECHAKKAGEKIAEKKAGGNVEKLEQLVDQLKGEIKSKDSLIKAEVKF